MIPYTKALELKEAGFPQNLLGGKVYIFNIIEAEYELHEVKNMKYAITGNPIDKEKELTYIPTLSELIQELGTDFVSVERLYPPDEDGMFWAKSNKIYECIGESPEMACLNLYLSLHKK